MLFPKSKNSKTEYVRMKTHEKKLRSCDHMGQGVRTCEKTEKICCHVRTAGSPRPTTYRYIAAGQLVSCMRPCMQIKRDHQCICICICICMQCNATREPATPPAWPHADIVCTVLHACFFPVRARQL